MVLVLLSSHYWHLGINVHRWFKRNLSKKQDQKQLKEWFKGTLFSYLPLQRAEAPLEKMRISALPIHSYKDTTTQRNHAWFPSATKVRNMIYFDAVILGIVELMRYYQWKPKVIIELLPPIHTKKDTTTNPNHAWFFLLFTSIVKCDFLW